MTIDECVAEFRRRKSTRPFQPFVISMADGTVFKILDHLAFGTDSKKRFTVVDAQEHFAHLLLKDISVITDAETPVDSR